jgi:hypothetical protein
MMIRSCLIVNTPEEYGTFDRSFGSTLFSIIIETQGGVRDIFSESTMRAEVLRRTKQTIRCSQGSPNDAAEVAVLLFSATRATLNRARETTSRLLKTNGNRAKGRIAK